MVNQDVVIGQGRETPSVHDIDFGLTHTGSNQVRQTCSLRTLPQNRLPHVEGRSVDETEIGLGQDTASIAGFYMAQNDDYEVSLPCQQGGYEPGSECDNKYDVIDHSALGVDQGGEVGDNEDHGETVRLDRQLAISSPGEELVFAESNGLALLDNNDIEDEMELVVHQNGNMEDLSIRELQFVKDSPVIQSRTMVPAQTHELLVGQDFADVKACRRALRDMAIAQHFEIQTVKSDKTRFTAKCASDGCPWRVHAAKLPGVPTFTIRTIQAEHNCGGINHLGHQQASVQWVASSVEQQLRENPHCKPKDLLEEIHRVHGITLSYKQAWRGKERFMASLRGSFEDDYRLLPQYCNELRRTNPGSIASVCVDPLDNSFQRLFISYQASIYGFLNACRPLIGLDRAVLKNKYLGTLLFATGFDGEGALFPLAFGVVDEESEGNWMWFLSELHNLLETNAENMPRLTILSDRQKSIVDAVEANFPTAFHGFCMLHLSESFRKEFNNSILVNLLWEAASAPTILGFDMKIMEIQQMSQDAAYWVTQIPPHLWANSHFTGMRFGQLTANVVDSLNAWISESSGLPIVQMMECIRRELMTWFNERREASMQWTSILVPSAERQVSDALEQARAYQVLKANEVEFEVISHEGTCMVDIRSRCCSCNSWQKYGLPCSHAVAVLLSCRQNVHRFTESWFTVATYRKAYSQTIHPIPDRSLWQEMSGGPEDKGYGEAEDIVVNPPKSLQPPALPRKRRARSGERSQVAKRIVRCSRCNQAGHFRTTCATPI